MRLGLQGLLLVMLGRCNSRMCLTLVGPVHAVRIVTYLWTRVTPVPVLTPSQRHVCWACHRWLMGALDAPVQLILSVTLEMML